MNIVGCDGLGCGGGKWDKGVVSVERGHEEIGDEGVLVVVEVH